MSIGGAFKRVILIIVPTIIIFVIDFIIHALIPLEAYDYLFMLTISIFFEGCSIMMICLIPVKKTLASESSLINDALEKNTVWLLSYVIWLAVYFLLTFIPILSSCIVVYVTSVGNANSEMSKIVFYSVISLAVSFIVILMHPLDIARGYRLAHTEIYHAISLYNTNSMCLGDLTKEILLVEALKKGETFISKHSFLIAD